MGDSIGNLFLVPKYFSFTILFLKKSMFKKLFPIYVIDIKLAPVTKQCERLVLEELILSLLSYSEGIVFLCVWALIFRLHILYPASLNQQATFI